MSPSLFDVEDTTPAGPPGGLRCGVCGRHRPQSGYSVCGRCAEAFEDDLAEVRERYPRLTATPGKGDRGGRGSPGFRSQPPGSVHVMAMRDRRSKGFAVRDDPECEQDNPPIAVYATLANIAQYVISTRRYRSIIPLDVDRCCDFLSAQSDWLMQQAAAGPSACESVHKCAVQLRSATGEPKPKPIGKCIGYLDDDRPCLAPIFMPEANPWARDEEVQGTMITCSRCNLEYDGRRLVILRLEAEAKK